MSRPAPTNRRPTVIELLYAALALIACLAIVATHLVGRALEDRERRDGWAELAAGRDPDFAGGTVLAAVAGFSAAPAPQVNADARPAELPAWVQAVRTTKLWIDASAGESIASVGQWQFLNVVSAEG